MHLWHEFNIRFVLGWFVCFMCATIRTCNGKLFASHVSTAGIVQASHWQAEVSCERAKLYLANSFGKTHNFWTFFCFVKNCVWFLVVNRNGRPKNCQMNGDSSKIDFRWWFVIFMVSMQRFMLFMIVSLCSINNLKLSGEEEMTNQHRKQSVVHFNYAALIVKTSVWISWHTKSRICINGW